MAKVEVLNWKREKQGAVELPEEIFDQPVRTDILHEVVTWQLNCRRQGTVATKTKGLVRGGGKKPFKQKGTGNARQGSNRSPLMPGGGTVFGPQPRDYSYTLPKKVRKAGLRNALAYLYKNGKLQVVTDMGSPEGKTKELASRLRGFGVNKAVLLDAAENDMFARAAKNLKGYRYCSVNGLNVFDLLKYDNLIMTKDSLAQVIGRCSN